MAYLLKPIDPEELEREISSAIAKKREMSQMRSARQLMQENEDKNCQQFWRDLFYEEIPSEAHTIRNQIQRLHLPLDLNWSYCPVLLVVRRLGKDITRRGCAFCYIGTIMPTGDQGTDLDNLSGMVNIQLGDQPQLLTSYFAGLEGVCISSSCKNPEKAMQFLEFLYTDPYVVNLLEYGVEGENYIVTSEGMADNGGTYFLIWISL